MKYNPNDSLLVYEVSENAINIGDYVQSLAAKQFLDQPVQYLSREKLHQYEGSETRLIMNGWFMHEAKNWPPAQAIKPLFVAFHLNSSATELLNTDQSIAYFKTHEPIGCRDKYTVNLLQQHDIKAFFTGCLTLTLGETYHSEQKDGKIYFVDPHMPVKRKSNLQKMGFLLNAIPHFNTIKKITAKKHNGAVTLRNYLNTSMFYKMYHPFFSNEVLQEAEYIHHLYRPEDFSNEKQMFEEAEKLLNKYAKAKLVVTSRIHCALPCLSMGTPVIYTDDLEKSEISSCRLDGLLELFNLLFIGKDKIVGSDMTDNINFVDSQTTISNKTAYQKLKNDLIEILNKNNYLIHKNNPS